MHVSAVSLLGLIMHPKLFCILYYYIGGALLLQIDYYHLLLCDAGQPPLPRAPPAAQPPYIHAIPARGRPPAARVGLSPLLTQPRLLPCYHGLYIHFRNFQSSWQMMLPCGARRSFCAPTHVAAKTIHPAWSRPAHPGGAGRADGNNSGLRPAAVGHGRCNSRTGVACWSEAKQARRRQLPGCPACSCHGGQLHYITCCTRRPGTLLQSGGICTLSHMQLNGDALSSPRARRFCFQKTLCGLPVLLSRLLDVITNNSGSWSLILPF